MSMPVPSAASNDLGLQLDHGEVTRGKEADHSEGKGMGLGERRGDKERARDKEKGKC